MKAKNAGARSALFLRAVGLAAILFLLPLNHSQSRGTPVAAQPSPALTGAPSTPSGAIPPTFFSLTIAFGNLTQWPTAPFGLLGEIPGKGWNTIAHARGLYKWEALDRDLDMAQSHGITTVSYNLHLTPAWASSNPDRPCTGESNVFGCADPPVNISDWDDFVRALVTRYKGRIQYYEVWDEPNRPLTWRGTVPDMVRLAQHAYGIIKEIDPSAKVLTPGVTVIGVQPSYPGCNLDCWLDRYLAAGGSQYADGVTWHGFYCRNSLRGCGNGIGCDVAINCAGAPLLNQIKLVRSMMAKYGMADKPLLDTSGGWGKDENLPDPDQQAAYVARWHILQAAEGVTAADWWGWNTKAWGTLWTETGETPAAEAYGQTYQWLVGATIAKPCSLADSIWSCELTRSGGYRGLIVWADSAAPITYSVPASFRRYRDLTGKAGQVSGAVTINYKPILLESGRE
jgi:hypothetical protein